MLSVALYPWQVVYVSSGRVVLLFPGGCSLLVEECGEKWLVRLEVGGGAASRSELELGPQRRLLVEQLADDLVAATAEAISYGCRVLGEDIFWGGESSEHCEAIIRSGSLDEIIIRGGDCRLRSYVGELDFLGRGGIRAKTLVVDAWGANHNPAALLPAENIAFIMGLDGAGQQQRLGAGMTAASWAELVRRYCRAAVRPRSVQYYIYTVEASRRSLVGFLRAAAADQVFLRWRSAAMEPLQCFDLQFVPDCETLHIDYCFGAVGKVLVAVCGRLRRAALALGYKRISLYCANPRLAAVLGRRWGFREQRSVPGLPPVKLLVLDLSC